MPPSRTTKATAKKGSGHVQPSEPCPICDRVLSRVHDLPRHIKSHDKDTKFDHRCTEPGCLYSDRQRSNVKVHMKNVHHKELLPLPRKAKGCPPAIPVSVVRALSQSSSSRNVDASFTVFSSTSPNDALTYKAEAEVPVSATNYAPTPSPTVFHSSSPAASGSYSSWDLPVQRSPTPPTFAESSPCATQVASYSGWTSSEQCSPTPSPSFSQSTSFTDDSFEFNFNPDWIAVDECLQAPFVVPSQSPTLDQFRYQSMQPTSTSCPSPSAGTPYNQTLFHDITSGFDFFSGDFRSPSPFTTDFDYTQEGLIQHKDLSAADLLPPLSLEFPSFEFDHAPLSQATCDFDSLFDFTASLNYLDTNGSLEYIF